jgi:hypothetical protein
MLAWMKGHAETVVYNSSRHRAGRQSRLLFRATCAVLCLLAPLLAEEANSDMLDLYALLTDKTILMPSGLPKLPDSVNAELNKFRLPADLTNAIAMLESAFASNGIAVVQDGPLFVRLLPVKQADFFRTNVPLRGDQFSTATNSKTNPLGMVDFRGAYWDQVLEIYAMARHRTVLRPAAMVCPPVRLESRNGMEMRAMIYAIETVLALNGVGLVDDGKKFVQAVPLSQRSRVIPNAPEPELGARLFEPESLPSTPRAAVRPAIPGIPPNAVAAKSGIPPIPPKPVSEVDREIARLRKALSDLIHRKGPARCSPQSLLEFYASMAGKTAQPSNSFEGMPIWFNITTPLSKNELAYAIETTFAMDGLAIIVADGQGIRLGSLTELGQGQSQFTYRVTPASNSARLRITVESLIAIVAIVVLANGFLKMRRHFLNSGKTSQK